MKSLPTVLLLLTGCAAPPASPAAGEWEPMPTGSTASLRGLAVVDADTVWASGSDGTVLRTIDGGRTWTHHVVPGDAPELRDVHAVDARTAYVLAVTEPARILRTTDGGATWDELYRSPHAAAFLDSFAFFDDRRACAFGDPIDGVFLVLRTEDAGAEWQEVPATAIPPSRAGEAAFAASGTCLAAIGEAHAWIATGGLASRVLLTTDAGCTWSASPTPIVAGERATGIYSIAFSDERHGVIVGGDYTAPERAERNAAFTSDGGRTWELADRLPRGHRAAVAWVPGRLSTLVTVGRAGTDWSTDGGRTWRSLSDEGFYAIAFAPTGEGWAAGSEGRIGRLTVPED